MNDDKDIANAGRILITSIANPVMNAPINIPIPSANFTSIGIPVLINVSSIGN